MSKTKKITTRNEEIRAEIKRLEEQKTLRAKMPTEEELGKWSRQDIQAALSFLHLILDDEEIMNKLVHELYQKHSDAEVKAIQLIEHQIEQLNMELIELENAD